MQKTTFPVEILLHDDASTDNTANIIREYEAKYPNIIKPIYQSENQYSQGIGISMTYQFLYQTPITWTKKSNWLSYSRIINWG